MTEQEDLGERITLSEQRLGRLRAKGAMINAGICPRCQQPFKKKVPLGRCVYLSPCGCRIG